MLLFHYSIKLGDYIECSNFFIVKKMYDPVYILNNCHYITFIIIIILIAASVKIGGN